MWVRQGMASLARIMHGLILMYLVLNPTGQSYVNAAMPNVFPIAHAKAKRVRCIIIRHIHDTTISKLYTLIVSQSVSLLHSHIDIKSNT